MPRTSKLRIFLSSALDEDVKPERETVIELIQNRSNYADFSGVEYWNANTLSPREHSIEQLEQSDLYLGVFGRRCGPVTEEEFLYARKNRKASLLFFRNLPEDPEPDKDREGKERVARLFSSLTVNDPTAMRYNDSTHLFRLVTNALQQHILRLVQAEPPPLSSEGEPQPWLVTLCDRDSQQPHVDRMLSAFLANAQRTVLVYGLSGAEEEDHESLVEWYHHLRLHPDYEPPSGKRRSEGFSDERRDPLIRLEWARGEGSLEERYAGLMGQFAGQFLNTDESSEPKLAQLITNALNGARQHITLRYIVRPSDVRKDDPQLLKRWLEFLLSLQITAERHVISVFICFHTVPGLIPKLFGGAGKLQSCIDVMKEMALPGVTVLPVLTSPTRDHAAVWAETRCLRHFPALDRDVLKRGATAPFAKQKKSELPFGLIKPELETALDDAFRAYHQPSRGARPQEKP